MNLLRLRPMTATALSFWIGFLACVMGCAQPVFASARPLLEQATELQAAPAPNGHMADAESCCHHGRNSSGNSEKHQHTQTISCCPLDATLLQKQDPVSHFRDFSSALVVTLLQF